MTRSPTTTTEEHTVPDAPVGASNARAAQVRQVERGRCSTKLA